MLKCFPLKEVLSGGDPSHQEELGGLPGESYLCDRLRCSSDIYGEIFQKKKKNSKMISRRNNFSLQYTVMLMKSSSR